MNGQNQTQGHLPVCVLAAERLRIRKKRVSVYGLTTDVKVADVEKLPSDDDSFDFAFSWAVLHHSPNNAQAINEIYRVFCPDGTTRIMNYRRYSRTGHMLWIRYGFLKGLPFCSLGDIHANKLENV